jgi:hypothetical protein
MMIPSTPKITIVNANNPITLSAFIWFLKCKSMIPHGVMATSTLPRSPLGHKTKGIDGILSVWYIDVECWMFAIDTITGITFPARGYSRHYLLLCSLASTTATQPPRIRNPTPTRIAAGIMIASPWDSLLCGLAD